ncbi:hypothetical protein LPJ61_000161 [Coemansia biformis]|uniref:RCK N-terminal domain-containing protein n=1 Tax=Coemansia biformis TaxID=1286918 RepID=A0A9W8D1A5_9FUNG|nr:hypothetical protein LPJ61_000161 [Coemansia biformis]
MSRDGRQRTSAQRSGAAGLNVGGTLQSSADDRRRSTAGANGQWMSRVLGAGRAAQVSQDAESINYENLDDLFHEVDDEPVPAERTTSSERIQAKLKALTAQRADATGALQPLPTRRQMFGMYLDSSPAGRRWDQVDALLNTLIAVLHVYSTTHIRTGHLSVPHWLLLCEAALGGLLLLQFIPRYLLAPDPLEYLRSQFSIITLVTALTPVVVVVNNLLNPSVHDTFMSAGNWVFLYPVIFWRLQPALLRCLVPIKNVYRMSPMTRNVLRALTTVFTTVLAITVLTHVMVFYQSKSNEVQGFDEAFFFIAVSAITGLSSDIEPDTWFTRSIVLLVMFIGIFWLPPRVSEMLSLWQDRSPWPSAYEEETNQMHVLVIGDLEYTALFEFLREFFCEDHGIHTVNTVVVVMSERSPGKEVSELLHDPSYVNRVKFVLGSPTSFNQLDSVQAERAQAVFLLSSKAAEDPAKEDAAKVMIALAVRKFLRARRHAVPIYAQVLLPETTLHMEFLADHVICIEELRLGLLAKNVLVPGFASLVAMLTSSIPDSIAGPLVRSAQRKTWLAEYAQSLSHEIYSTKISPLFNGAKFQRAAQGIFQRTGSTLFALLIPASDDGEDAYIAINPVDYVLRGGELGFVITDNALASVQIAYLSEASEVDLDAATAPLLPGGPANADESDGAPDRPHPGLLKPTVPFGKNVMDTVVVSSNSHSIEEELLADNMSRRSADRSRAGGSIGARSTGSPDEDLIDMAEISDCNEAGPSALASELAQIVIEEDQHKKGSSDDSDDVNSDSRMHRTPLVFDPNLHKPAEGDSAGKKAEEAPKGDQPDSAAGLRGRTQRAEPVVDTPDGLPGDLAGHVVVCDTSSEFPSNITYLVSCIRSAAPSEVTSIADGPGAKPPSSSAIANPFASLYEQISRSYNTQKQVGEKEPAQGSFLNQQPIVILSPADVPEATSNDLQRFGNVHVVAGSPLSRTDLARVRIHTAGNAIVLANREEWLRAAADTASQLSLSGADTTATATADAPALLSVLNIEALTYSNTDFFLSVEFIHRENMQFVGDTETLRINEVYGQAFLRPSFMSGRVYAPVMLDTLICQTYYNNHLLEILQQLIFSHGSVTHALGMAKLREAGIDTPATDDQQPRLGTGHVFLVAVPRRFRGCTYASLFSYCCFKHGAISIGLYRAAIHNRQPLWYVVPNPAPACVLREGDRIYLIAATRPVLQ